MPTRGSCVPEEGRNRKNISCHGTGQTLGPPPPPPPPGLSFPISEKVSRISISDSDSRLCVTLDTGISVTASRAGIDQFDAFIVDEGQDLLLWPILKKLDRHLAGGFENGRWCFFYDVNNQAGMFGPVDEDTLAYLESSHPAKVPLRVNCRNTKIILEKVKTLLGADMGIRGVGEGPEIRERTVDSDEDSARAIEQEINYIVERGGLPHKELTILSPKPFEASSVALLKSEILKQISVLDGFSFRSFPPKEISFSQIRNFKGLENEAVILADLQLPGPQTEIFTEHYIAMSSCPSGLVHDISKIGIPRKRGVY